MKDSAIKIELEIKRYIYASGMVCYVVWKKCFTQHEVDCYKRYYNAEILYETISESLARQWMEGYINRQKDSTVISSEVVC